MPYYLFEKLNLSRIATAVGKPVALAPETERKETFEVAKVLVRVDLTKELPSKVVLGFSSGREIEISVSYPWLPPRCMECNAYGHERSQCKLWRPATQSGQRIQSRSVSRPRTSRRSRQGRSALPKRRYQVKETIMLNGAPAEWKVKEGPKVSVSVKQETSVSKEQGLLNVVGANAGTVLVEKRSDTTVASTSTTVVVGSVGEDLAEAGSDSIAKVDAEVSVGNNSGSVGLDTEGLDDSVSVWKTGSVGSVSKVSVSAGTVSDSVVVVTEGLIASDSEELVSVAIKDQEKLVDGEGSSLKDPGKDFEGKTSSAEVEAPFILVKRRKSSRKTKLNR